MRNSIETYRAQIAESTMGIDDTLSESRFLRKHIILLVKNQTFPLVSTARGQLAIMRDRYKNVHGKI